MEGNKRSFSMAFPGEVPPRLKRKSTSTVSAATGTIGALSESADLSRPSLRKVSTLTLEEPMDSEETTSRASLSKRSSTSKSRPVSLQKKNSVEKGALVSRLSGLKSGSIVGETTAAEAPTLSKKKSSIKTPSIPSGLTKTDSSRGTLRVSKSKLLDGVDETEMASALESLKSKLSKTGSKTSILSTKSGSKTSILSAKSDSVKSVKTPAMSRASSSVSAVNDEADGPSASAAAPLLPPGGLMEIVISFDTTGSMYSCLDKIKAKIKDLVQRLQADIPGIRIAIIAHGDYCDASNYIIKWIDFGASIPEIYDFVQTVGRTDGGDAAECYELVLLRAREAMSWTPGSQRVLVVINDNIPHEPGYRYGDKTYYINWREECAHLKNMGVKVYGVRNGIRPASAMFNDEMASLTGGKHLNLDDFDSLFDFIMMICYRETNPDMIEVYEAEMMSRPGRGIAMDVARVATDFKGTSGASPVTFGSPPLQIPSMALPSTFNPYPITSDAPPIQFPPMSLPSNSTSGASSSIFGAPPITSVPLPLPFGTMQSGFKPMPLLTKTNLAKTHTTPAVKKAKKLTAKAPKKTAAKASVKGKAGKTSKKTGALPTTFQPMPLPFMGTTGASPVAFGAPPITSGPFTLPFSAMPTDFKSMPLHTKTNLAKTHKRPSAKSAKKTTAKSPKKTAAKASVKGKASKTSKTTSPSPVTFGSPPVPFHPMPLPFSGTSGATPFTFGAPPITSGPLSSPFGAMPTGFNPMPLHTKTNLAKTPKKPTVKKGKKLTTKAPKKTAAKASVKGKASKTNKKNSPSSVTFGSPPVPFHHMPSPFHIKSSASSSIFGTPHITSGPLPYPFGTMQSGFNPMPLHIKTNLAKTHKKPAVKTAKKLTAKAPKKTAAEASVKGNVSKTSKKTSPSPVTFGSPPVPFHPMSLPFSGTSGATPFTFGAPPLTSDPLSSPFGTMQPGFNTMSLHTKTNLAKTPKKPAVKKGKKLTAKAPKKTATKASVKGKASKTSKKTIPSPVTFGSPPVPFHPMSLPFSGTSGATHFTFGAPPITSGPLSSPFGAMPTGFNPMPLHTKTNLAKTPKKPAVKKGKKLTAKAPMKTAAKASVKGKASKTSKKTSPSTVTFGSPPVPFPPMPLTFRGTSGASPFTFGAPPITSGPLPSPFGTMPTGFKPMQLHTKTSSAKIPKKPTVKTAKKPTAKTSKKTAAKTSVRGKSGRTSKKTNPSSSLFSPPPIPFHHMSLPLKGMSGAPPLTFGAPSLTSGPLSSPFGAMPTSFKPMPVHTMTNLAKTLKKPTGKMPKKTAAKASVKGKSGINSKKTGASTVPFGAPPIPFRPMPLPFMGTSGASPFTFGAPPITSGPLPLPFTMPKTTKKTAAKASVKGKIGKTSKKTIAVKKCATTTSGKGTKGGKEASNILKRESLPDAILSVGAMKSLVWTEWLLAISPVPVKPKNKSEESEYDHCAHFPGHRIKHIFGNKSQTAAIYELAVKAPGSKASKKYTVFFKKTTGYNSKRSWESFLLSNKLVRKEVSMCIAAGCSLWVRQGVPKGRSHAVKSKEVVLMGNSLRKSFDYAWMNYPWRKHDGKMCHRQLEIMRRGAAAITISHSDV